MKERGCLRALCLCQEVRDTFRDRMGWTDRETVALIGGGHTLGRTHGNCHLDVRSVRLSAWHQLVSAVGL